ncbi:hypothetical protein LK08_21600 [Streptomyces sp. MUSC 125]|nr:hypothetical protein LK06_018205 [Streptomyces pluripotens]KIE25154.1 hypothetical protein LK08_21600 [Streptomyces sp. MUSC 125]
MDIRMRDRRAVGPVALVAAAALALAGCQGGDEGTKPEQKPTPVATASAAGSPTPTPTSTPAPTTSPTPTVATLRDQAGGTVGRAVTAARGRGLHYAVYLQGTGASLHGGGRRATSWGTGEKVCRQIDDPTDVNSTFDVAFVIARDGRDCAGRLLHTPTPTPVTTPSRNSTGGGGSGTGGTTTTCAITSPAGNCYADGQFCATRHHGLSTYGKGGEYLTCERDSAGVWRWSDGRAG